MTIYRRWGIDCRYLRKKQKLIRASASANDAAVARSVGPLKTREVETPTDGLARCAGHQLSYIVALDEFFQVIC